MERGFEGTLNLHGHIYVLALDRVLFAGLDGNPPVDRPRRCR